MKIFTFAIILLCIFTYISNASDIDPLKIFERSILSYKEGKYEESLKDLIWFHENALKYDQSLGAVRRSYALSGWVELGKVYPEALKALKEIRDLKITALKCGNGTPFEFADVAAINQNLDEPEITIELFRCISNKYPEVAVRSYGYAKKDLINAGEYELCGHFISDVENEAKLLQDKLSFYLNYYCSNNSSDTNFYKWTISKYISEAEGIIKILIYNNRTDEANKFYSLALQNTEIEEIHAALSKIHEKYLANKEN